MPLVGFTGREFHQYPSVMDREKNEKKKNFTIQIQKHEHLGREIAINAMSGKRNGQK
jgi:hypothetical protein